MTIYLDDLKVAEGPIIVSGDDGAFVTCVLSEEYAGLNPCFGMIHVWHGWMFCLSPHRIHANTGVEIQDGSYAFAPVDGGLQLTFQQPMEDDLAQMLAPIEQKLLMPFRLVDLPSLNITAARSLARNGLVATLVYSCTHMYVRWSAFIGAKSLEAAYTDVSIHVSPEYLYEAALRMGGSLLASVTSDRKMLALWAGRRYYSLIAAFNLPTEYEIQELLDGLDAEVSVVEIA